jgi:hypothetical protein
MADTKRREFNPAIPADVRDDMVNFFSGKCIENEKTMPLLDAVKAADNSTFEEFGFRIADMFV